MSSLNYQVRRLLLEYLARNELAFHALANKIKVGEDTIISWVSGNHDFTLNEISLIESGLQFKLITLTENDSNQKKITDTVWDNILQNSLSNYSVRFQNIIKKLATEYKDPFLFYAKLNEVLEKNVNLPNAGKSTLKELERFRNYLSENGFQFGEKDHKYFDFVEIFQNRYKLPESISRKTSKRIENGESFIFKLLDDIFKYSAHYKETQRGTLNIFTSIANDGREMPLTEAADLLNVTRERIRQLKLKIDDEILNLGKGFMSIFGSTKLVDQYPFLFKPTYIAIDSKLSSEINTTEDVKFSIRTFALLLKGLKFPEREMVRFKTNTIYIIPASWIKLFSFNKLNERVRNVTMLNIWEWQDKSLVQLFGDLFLGKSPDREDEILNFVKHILSVEYEFSISPPGQKTDIRPRNLSLFEKIYLAIIHFNRPVNIREIIEFIEREYPGTRFTRGSIHTALIRSRLIMTFGKTGRYALKKWEDEREDIKSGSIADLVFEYLESISKPSHIYDIHFHIAQYRKTSKQSILSIMSLDTNHRFELFGNGYYGIAGKNYDTEDLASNPINNRTIGAVRRLLIEGGPLTVKKVEQYIIDIYKITQSQATHFLEEASEKGRLKIIESKVYLPLWIENGLEK